MTDKTPAPAASPTPPTFTELSPTGSEQGEVALSMLLDLSLPVSIELGRTKMTVQEILRLGRGSRSEERRVGKECR
jgi:flagellar motor switch protein FliN/FliY